MADNFKHATIIAAYKRLFLNGQDGKTVLNDLASDGMLDASTFDPTPSVAAYNQGRRDVVLAIFEKLNMNLVEYLTSNVTMEDC